RRQPLSHRDRLTTGDGDVVADGRRTAPQGGQVRHPPGGADEVDGVDGQLFSGGGGERHQRPPMRMSPLASATTKSSGAVAGSTPCCSIVPIVGRSAIRRMSALNARNSRSNASPNSN